MSRMKEVLSIGLLIAGVALVFVGVTRSVGFSQTDIASLAAVAVLYSGAVFCGASAATHSEQRDTIFVFDRTFRLVSGGHKGLPIRAVLSEIPDADIESRCSAVFTRKSDRFAYTSVIVNPARHHAPAARV